jgi:hypothetical protein
MAISKQFVFGSFHSRTVQQHLDIIRVLYLPTDAQDNCFKKNIKIYIKTAPTCFGLITFIRERISRAQIIRSLMMVTAPKHDEAVLM